MVWEWEGIEDALRNPHPATGEKIVSAGGPELQNMNVTATFGAASEGIEAQSLLLRLFAVDYLPGRERVYSTTFVLHVLTPEEHAIWLTNQLRKWSRQAQEVYEQEQRLYEANKEIRNMSPEEIDQPDTRRRIETQAALEQANGRRLSALTGAGAQLIQEATRNDQFNVETLENWAEILKALQDIAENRMPSVSDLLAKAATAPGSGKPGQAGEPGEPSENKAEQTPNVGNNRDPRSGKGKKQKADENAKTVPSISDVESGFNELNETKKDDEEQPAGKSKLTLPTTTVQGGGLPPDENAESPPAQEQVEEAVEEQEDLLAEFAKVAEELQKILDNLEASTFVKRLKAASRRQLDVANDLNQSLRSEFGVPETEVDEVSRERGAKIADRELAQSDSVYIIQEDLEAYFNRVQQGKFKTVLNEMKTDRRG